MATPDPTFHVHWEHIVNGQGGMVFYREATLKNGTRVQLLACNICSYVEARCQHNVVHRDEKDQLIIRCDFCQKDVT